MNYGSEGLGEALLRKSASYRLLLCLFSLDYYSRSLLHFSVIIEYFEAVISYEFTVSSIFSDKTLSAFKIEATINCEFTVCSMFDFSDQTSYAFINRGAFE